MAAAGHRGELRSPRSGRPAFGCPERWFLIALVAVVGVLPACRQNESTGPPLEIKMRVRPDPPVVGPAAIEVDIRDAAGTPVRGAVVKVEGNMTHPGMAPSLAAAKEGPAGTYRADLELTMAGDWVISIDARLADGETVRRTLPLSGVRGH